jgi:hypothetical protein
MAARFRFRQRWVMMRGSHAEVTVCEASAASPHGSVHSAMCVGPTVRESVASWAG